MDNDDATIGTIYSRREAMLLAAKAGLTLTAGGLLASVPGQSPAGQKVNLVASPALTEGPFFVDAMLNRSNLLEGTTREAVVKATPLDLRIYLHRLAGDKRTPFAGCQVDVWHCDAKGVYSAEDHPMNHEKTGGQTWLRGHQTTDAKGMVAFQTIVPGWYPGRTAHIHFKVRTFSEKHQVTADFTSQLFFDEAFINRVYSKVPYSGQKVEAGLNMRDGIFAERQADGSVAGSKLLVDLSKEKGRDVATFTILLSDQNFRAGGLESWDQF